MVYQAGDITGFWDCCGLVYPEFGPDAQEKQNVTQDTYLDTLMHLRNAIQSKRWGFVQSKSCFDLWQCSSTSSTVDSDRGERFSEGTVQTPASSPPYSPDLAWSDCHLFPRLKKKLGGQCFQTCTISSQTDMVITKKNSLYLSYITEFFHNFWCYFKIFFVTSGMLLLF